MSFPHTLGEDKVLQLESFVLSHVSHNRPLALVTSGGTAADLEERAVRSLENFSTGLRGALSVELLLEKGYAVIHLWRTGSAAPYGRALSQALGQAQANHGIALTDFENLLEQPTTSQNGHAHHQDNENNKSFWDWTGLGGGGGGQPRTDPTDPWLTETKDASSSAAAGATYGGGLSLHHRLVHDGQVQKAMRECVESEGRLLTVPFRTVEEYLGRLELCSKALRDGKSLAMVYLAAAVSDFYCANKSPHKISIESNQEGLTLQLDPVPKVMGVLRKEWAPDAFCVSFKLETDPSVLRRKSQRAVDKYGVHMVIGNLLETRKKQVWLLIPNDNKNEKTNGSTDATANAEADANATSAWLDVTKPSHHPVIERVLLDHVAEQHFSFVSKHHDQASVGQKAQQYLQERKQALERQWFWKRVETATLQAGGTLLGMALTYTISVALQRRIAK